MKLEPIIQRKAFLSLLAILWNSAFKWEYLSFSPLLFAFLLFTAICKASSDSHFAFCISFSWGWSWFLSPVQCHKPLSIVHQALCLSDLVPEIYFSLPPLAFTKFSKGSIFVQINPQFLCPKCLACMRYSIRISWLTYIGFLTKTKLITTGVE